MEKNLDPKTKKRRATLLRRAVIVAAILGASVLVTYALIPDPFAVDLATVVRGTVRVTVDGDGRTRVKDRFVMVAPITGSLARLELRAGDAVREGDPIARLLAVGAPLLDPRARAQADARVGATAAAIRQADTAISRLRMALELAQREEARIASLVERGAASAQAIDRARSERESRAQELTSAEFGIRIARHENLMARAAIGDRVDQDDEEELLVRSPIEGRVLRILHESDGPVAPGTPLLELGDARALELVVDVLTSDAVRITPGARARVSGWGGTETLDAHVRIVEPSARTRVSALGVEEQRVDVVLDLDSPPSRFAALGDGYRVEVSVVVAEARDTLVVPELAVFRDGPRHAVFVARDGVAHMRTITIGLRNGVDVEVRRGLSSGDRVIVHPGEGITDGVRVVRR